MQSTTLLTPVSIRYSIFKLFQVAQFSKGPDNINAMMKNWETLYDRHTTLNFSCCGAI